MLSIRRVCAAWLALSALVAIAAPGGRAAEEKTYDLLGAAPKKGQTFTVTTRNTLKDGKVHIDNGTMKVELGLETASTAVLRLEVLEVKGRHVLKARVKVVKDEATKRVNFGGAIREKSPLAGETVVVERTKTGWKQTLGGSADPTEQQKKKMAALELESWEEAVLPAKKVAVGHKWEVDAGKLPRLFDASLSDASGKVKGCFVKTERVGGRECAVIELDVDVKGTAASAGEERKVEYKGKVTLYRSPALAANLKSKASIDVKFSGKEKMPTGSEADVELKGKVTLESTATVK